MFWGLWAGQPGCMKMGDHKTPFECYKLYESMKYLDMICTIKHYSVNGTPMKHCKVCVGGLVTQSIDPLKGNENSKKNQR